MIDWLIAQQGVLCLILLLMIVIEHFLTDKLGALFTYRLWLLVPLALILNNIPVDVVATPVESLSRYVVGVKPEIVTQDLKILFSLWAFGVSLLTAYVLVHHMLTYLSISKRKAVHTNAYYSRHATTPMLFGFVAPKILLPYSFKSAFSHAQQALVLEHENVHRKHKDHLWNTLAMTMTILFWFNPIAWIALKSFRVSQEMACDHEVLKNKTNSERLDYAKALVQCAEQCSSAITLYPTFGEKSTMIKRLNSMKHPAATSKIAAAATLSIASLILANTALANVPPPPPKKAESKMNAAQPIKRVEPTYPASAINENQEGYVVMEFDITETGTTDNIKVIDSIPKGVFDDSAMTALKEWHYKPRIQGGQALRQTGLLVQLDYKLSDESLTVKHTDEMEIITIKK